METLPTVEPLSRAPGNRVPPFHLVTVVWGRAFTRNYLDLVLPTHLSPGNLPALARASGSLYKIYTTTEDAAVIRADWRLAAASRHVPTQIVEFAPSAEGLSFDSMIVNHRRAIIEANAAGAAFIALPPDTIFSDGSFAALLRLRAAGKRLVLVTGLRASLKSFSSALRSSHEADATGAVTLPPRELMRLTLENLHPISRSFFWDSSNFIIHPANLYWWVRADRPRAILARCFHLHPIFVDPARKDIVPSSSIDDDYIHDTCPDPATHHVVTDSDELACVELSRDDHLSDFLEPNRADIRKIALWCLEFCHDTHRQLVQCPILLHDGAPPPDFSAAVESSRVLTEKILRRHAFEHRFESLETFFWPVLRWRGWLWERQLLRRMLPIRAKRESSDAATFHLDSCRPTDLIVIHGTVFGATAMRARLGWSGHYVFEKLVSPGHFRWVLPAALSYGPKIRVSVSDGTLDYNLRLNRISIWRTALHHLRHNYQENRPGPLWLEWQGLRPGHRLEGPCTVRVIPCHGVTHITLELRTVANPEEPSPTQFPVNPERKVPTNARRHSVTLPLDPRRPGEPIRVDLPDAHWLLAVSCREKTLWRAYKELLQILSVISAAVFTRAGRRQLVEILNGRN